jgi:hypothetical protein
LTARDYDPRSFNADSTRAYFNTDASLVPEDINGRWDVYEYDIATGRRKLLSSGWQNGDAYLGDVTPDGTSVFIVTDQALVGSDDDGLDDLYVARVNGGFLEPPPPLGECADDACQGAAAPQPAAPIVGSLTFAGTGNDDLSSTTGRLTVTKVKPITGSVATLKVTVPGPGVIRASGASVRASTRSASRAATYSVRVSLTTKARAALKRKGTLKPKVRVVFSPSNGTTASQTVALTFKQPKAQKQAGKKAPSQRRTSGKGGR